MTRKKRKLTTIAAAALKLSSFDFGQLGPITYSSFIMNGLDQLEWGSSQAWIGPGPLDTPIILIGIHAIINDKILLTSTLLNPVLEPARALSFCSYVLLNSSHEIFMIVISVLVNKEAGCIDDVRFYSPQIENSG